MCDLAKIIAFVRSSPANDLRPEDFPPTECPFCGKGMCYITSEPMRIRRAGNMRIVHWFYKCNGCKEGYTTNEMDDITLKQVRLWKPKTIMP